MRMSKRLDTLQPYLFVEISKRIAEKRAKGIDVISFGIGDPDIPTPTHIIETLCREARNPVNHRYPESDGLPELRKAVAYWYEKRFGVTLDPNKEIEPLIGAKEGLAHMAFCLIDAGDIALITDPAYPVYSIGTRLAGGEPYFLPLTKENKFLPDLDNIPGEVLTRAKCLWLNYPNNPTGAVAGLDFFEKAVAFGKKHNIPVLHDGPYSEVAYDGYQPASFMQAKGSKDIGMEFHSCSKTYNMTGWRIGMAVGNPELIGALKNIKSNMDSGIFRALQDAAVCALSVERAWITARNQVYRERLEIMLQGLRAAGIKAMRPRAGLYVWARIPGPVQGLAATEWNSDQFALQLLEQMGVAVAPGSFFGPAGEGYVRLSITAPASKIRVAMERIAQFTNSMGSAPA